MLPGLEIPAAKARGLVTLAYHWQWLDPKTLLISRVVIFTLMIALVLARVLMDTGRGKGILRIILDDFNRVVVWDSIDGKTE
jgi:hypothetical protein